LVKHGKTIERKRGIFRKLGYVDSDASLEPSNDAKCLAAAESIPFEAVARLLRGDPIARD